MQTASTMTSRLMTELATTCHSLGQRSREDNEYYSNEYTVETVKDLIRYLRRDDENHEIRRILGHTDVVSTDLLPLLKRYWQQEELFDVVLRLLVNLTNPALLLYREEMPTEKNARNYYLQLIGYLQAYKEAFIDGDVWAVLSSKLGKLLEIEWQERSDEHGIVIERILILVRNILQVPADPEAEKRPDNDASVHDQVLWALHQSGLVDIFLYMATSENEQTYYMHILEITSLMLREQTAASLADSSLRRSATEKQRDEAELLAIRQKENRERQQKVKMYNGARHTRFGGTFVVKNMKSISENDLIYHKPLNKLDSLNFDLEKNKLKKPKNRRPVQDEQRDRRSAFSIRLFLKEFCLEFLNGAYNTLMYNVKDLLARAKAQAHDESYYLWCMRFFMEFNRHHKFQVKLVSETMSVQTFHFVQQQIETYFDMMSTDKKKLQLWSRRLHLGLRAYRELLLTMIAMDKSPDGSVRDSAQVIKSNIFYVLEYREILLTMMLAYDELKMSRSYLNDLIETQHIFMKMLEAFCSKDTKLVVQRKMKAKSSKKKKSKPAKVVVVPNVQEQWDEATPELFAVLKNPAEIPPDIVPFDAASDVSIDEQNVEAMCKIQRLLRQRDYAQAIGLLRAAREVWPANDSFGKPAMPPDEEFMAVREIFFADIQDDALLQPPAPEDADADAEDNNAYDDDEEDEEGGMMNERIAETDFKFEDFVNRYAHPKVVRACALALQTFEVNTPQVNHCVAKLLHRIAFDCKMPCMIFQATIFRVFQTILKSTIAPNFKELAKFAKFIIGKFVEIAPKNPHIYMELLFWKNSREAFDLEQGYGSYQENSGASKRAWTELEEDELRRLFIEHRDKGITDDVVDWIGENLIDHTRTRRAVLIKLKELSLLGEYRGKKNDRGGKARPPKDWSQEEETQLQELFTEHREALDPLGCIIERLTVRRPKPRIIEKLLSMGLIQDRKEVRRRRAGKSHGGNPESDDDIDSLAESDEEDGPSTAKPKPSGRNQKATTSRKSRKTPLSKSYSRLSVAKLLMEVMDKDMMEALKWLHESLSDAADDLEQEADDEGVPLVPITDDEMSAVENDLFQKLLRALGILAPFGEQEMYWRIPGELTMAEIRNRCDILKEAVDGTLTLPATTTESAQRVEDQESSDEDVFARVKQYITPADRMLQEEPITAPPVEPDSENILALFSDQELASEDEDDVVNDSNPVGNRSTGVGEQLPSKEMNRNSGIFRNDETDEEKTDTGSKLNVNVDSDIDDEAHSKKIKKKNRIILNDDSDEESGENIEVSHDSLLDVDKPKRKSLYFDSDSDGDVTESTKRVRTLESDSDSGVRKIKRLKLVLSDDED